MCFFVNIFVFVFVCHVCNDSGAGDNRQSVCKAGTEQ